MENVTLTQDGNEQLNIRALCGGRVTGPDRQRQSRELLSDGTPTLRFLECVQLPRGTRHVFITPCRCTSSQHPQSAMSAVAAGELFREFDSVRLV